jgi:hypothetical protein
MPRKAFGDEIDVLDLFNTGLLEDVGGERIEGSVFGTRTRMIAIIEEFEKPLFILCGTRPRRDQMSIF